MARPERADAITIDLELLALHGAVLLGDDGVGARRQHGAGRDPQRLILAERLAMRVSGRALTSSAQVHARALACQ